MAWRATPPPRVTDVVAAPVPVTCPQLAANLDRSSTSLQRATARFEAERTELLASLATVQRSSVTHETDAQSLRAMVAELQQQVTDAQARATQVRVKLVV